MGGGGGVRSRLRVVAALVGLGLVAGAVGVVVVAWLFGDPPVDTAGLRWSYREVADGDVWSPVTAAAIVAVLVPVCAVVLGLLYRRSRRRVGEDAWPLSGGGRLLRGLVLLAFAVVVVLLLVVLLPLFDREDHVAADVGGRLVLSTVALLAVVVGAVLVVVGVGRSLPMLRAVPTAVAVTVGVVLVGVPGFAVGVAYSDATHTDATTASPAEASPPPAAPARRAWGWRTDQQVLDVQAAGAGFAVLTTRGVIAVDGTTGAERWHYLRDDLSVDYDGRLRVLDGGRTVVLPLGGPGRLHAFDAFTGELLWQNESDEWLTTEVADARAVLVSVEPRPDRGEVAVARHSRTGAVMWRQPLGCSLIGFAEPPPREPSDVVIVRCESEQNDLLVVALDAKDGRELWRNEWGTGEVDQGPGAAGPEVGQDAGPEVGQDAGPEVGQGAGAARPDVVAFADDAGRTPVVRLYDQRSGAPLGGFPGWAVGSGGAAFDGRSYVEPGRGVRWTYDGSRGDFAVERGVRMAAVLPDTVVALTHRPGGTPHERLLLVLDRENGAVRHEFPVSTYGVSEVGADDGPWVIAGPGAVVTVTDRGSTTGGGELVGYR